MIRNTLLLLSLLFLISCLPASNLKKAGAAFQKDKSYSTLNEVVELLPLGSDTSLVTAVLGTPNANMGFDYRYLLDSVGPNNCVIGAVFHIDEEGKIDQKWIDEICE